MKEVTDRLGGLFAWCVGRLSEADRAGEPVPAADAAKVLGVHAGTWRELQRSLSDEAAVPQAIAAAPATGATPAAAAGYGDESAGVSWAA